MNAYVVMSGGIDSTVALWDALDRGYESIIGISFDYGQRHCKELSHAELIADQAGIEWRCIDITGITAAFGNSAITGIDTSIPRVEYDRESMADTVVPMRNPIMLSIAAAMAFTDGGGVVIAGMHGGDHALYPDCRPDFVAAMQSMVDHALGDTGVVIHAPFINLTKAEIVTLGAALDVTFGDTWSCYEGGDIHCGECGTCRERRAAFDEAGIIDPTRYEVSIPS